MDVVENEYVVVNERDSIINSEEEFFETEVPKEVPDFDETGDEGPIPIPPLAQSVYQKTYEVKDVAYENWDEGNNAK